MPIINGIQPVQGPLTPDALINSMQQFGPMVPIEVSVPDAFSHEMIKAGLAVPQPIVGHALIDTGATITSVNDIVMQTLRVTPINQIPIGGVSGGNMHNVYPARISFPGAGGLTWFSSVVGVNLGEAFIGGLPLIGLIGRDLLKHGVLIYNGSAGTFTLALG